MGVGEIDGEMAPDNGDLVGGINLGFDWANVVEGPTFWGAEISNALCENTMTVDVTPRRCQQFKPVAGKMYKWASSTGQKGKVKADPWGLVTIKAVKINAGEITTLKIKELGR